MEEGTEDERGNASEAEKGKPETKVRDVENTTDGREKAGDTVEKVEEVEADGVGGKTLEKNSSSKRRAKASKEEVVVEEKHAKEERDKQPVKEPAAKAPISSFFSEFNLFFFWLLQPTVGRKLYCSGDNALS